MDATNPWSSQELGSNDDERKQFRIGSTGRVGNKVDQNFISLIDTVELTRIQAGSTGTDTPSMAHDNSQAANITEDKPADIDGDGQETLASHQDGIVDSHYEMSGMGSNVIPETPLPEDVAHSPDSGDIIDIEALDTHKDVAHSPDSGDIAHIEVLDTHKMVVHPFAPPIITSYKTPQTVLKRGTAILLLSLLAIIVLQAVTGGPTQFLGAQGWASVLGEPAAQSGSDLLRTVNKQITHAVKPGATVTVKVQMTPEQYINLIVHGMTLDQKLGQMMIVQFVGATYALPISTMISQYDVGAVLVFTANGNVVSKGQLTDLIRQMKSNSTTIPLAVAIDQEGGTVDRLINLDGARPAATTLGASNNPTIAKQAGIQDAQDLASYGFNLNLAPVVDVSNVYNSQMVGRTFGDTAAQVTKMAGAYLQGLQQSGKVVGTLKHFPGLGDVSVDPHLEIPFLTRTKSDLENIDWAPYRALIKSGNVHAIMVTHEVIEALDPTEPSSLSPKVVQNILRNELGFQGVIMTDSLTMDALTAYATESQAAVLAIEAGSDLLMGASTPGDVASMFQAIKQAISTGAITEQRIDQSVRRILMMKYAMGLLSIPKN